MAGITQVAKPAAPPAKPVPPQAALGAEQQQQDAIVGALLPKTPKIVGVMQIEKWTLENVQRWLESQNLSKLKEKYAPWDY